MKRSELEHVIRAAAAATQEMEFVIIGSQSILGKCPDAPRVLRKSVECDIYPRNCPEKGDVIDGSLGERSLFHETHKYYAHGVSDETATLPCGWQSRLIPVKTEQTNGATGWCLEPHDLAYSKLAAGREKDIEFVVEMRRHAIVRPSKMMELLTQADESSRDLIERRWLMVERQWQKERASDDQEAKIGI